MQEKQLLSRLNKAEQRIVDLYKKLTKSSSKLPYKVFTALLTQSGGNNQKLIDDGELTIGVTYFIEDPAGGDWTNVGAPNNNYGTYFVATGTTPNSWGINAQLTYNIGAPVATVLENTIGNVWFTYIGEGNYSVKSGGLFTLNKTFAPSVIINTIPQIITINVGNINEIELLNSEGDSALNNAPIEIRVYN
jgi:hypothetical protein